MVDAKTSRASGRSGRSRRPGDDAVTAAAAETRRRLLDAAGAVFAQRGYREGTVREICHRAGANVSAVGYHFGSKAALYEAVLRQAQEYAAERYPIQGLAEAARSDAPAALEAFVEVLLRRILDRGRPAWHGRLMTRELAEPGPGFRIVTEEVVGPMVDELAAIVALLTGEPAESQAVRRSVAGIIGQCTVYRNAPSLLDRRPSGDEIHGLAAHITGFSLAGLAFVAEGVRG